MMLCVTVRAQNPPAPANERSVRSFSGQFVVRGNSSTVLQPKLPEFARDGKHLVLQPALLTVSCERIKQTLDGLLNDRSQWKSKIFVSLQPAQTAEDEIGFLAEHFKDGWAYRMEIPTPVDRTRLVRAVTLVWLTEHANRKGGERSAEIPLWLLEGLTQTLLADHAVEVLLTPPQAAENFVPISRSVVTNDMSQAWRKQAQRGPMSLEELSWPKENQLNGVDAAIYGQSARLFISELMRFQDGRDCLRTTIEELPNYLNWQMAFLRGFRTHFTKLLDVEKWWALQVDFFNNRDAHGMWSSSESWQKLDAILRTPVEARRDLKELPQSTEIPFKTVLSEWEFQQQEPVLTTKLTELDSARGRVAPEFVSLVDSYRRFISEYLTTQKKRKVQFDVAVQEAAKQFEVLELIRQKMKPKAAAPVASAGPTMPKPVKK